MSSTSDGMFWKWLLTVVFLPVAQVYYLYKYVELQPTTQMRVITVVLSIPLIIVTTVCWLWGFSFLIWLFSGFFHTIF